MLRLFRTNQLLAAVLYLPYLALLRLPVYLSLETVRPPRLSSDLLLIDAWRWLYEQPLLLEVVTFSLLFVQAVYLTYTIIQRRVTRDITLFPGLVFLLLASLLPQLLPFSPVLLANLLVWIALDQLLNTYRNHRATGSIFNTGWWLGLSSLVMPVYALLLFFGFIGLNNLRRFQPREYFLMLAGFLVPIFLCGVGLFWFDRLADLELHYTSHLAFMDWGTASDTFDAWGLVPYGLLLLIVLFTQRFYFAKQVIAVRKVIQLIFWLLLFSLPVAVFKNESGLEQVLLTCLPLGFLLSLNLTNLSRPWAELMHLAGWLVYLLFQYGPVFLPLG